MQLAEMVFLGIVLYLLYRFVFNFLLPIVRTTKQVREQFKNMQDHMQDQAGGFRQDTRQQEFFQEGSPARPRNSHSQTGARQKPDTGSAVKGKAGSKSDYIDFEEIK
ncbi:hypothetical protein ACX0G9_13855 [Flavitalea flava]